MGWWGPIWENSTGPKIPGGAPDYAASGTRRTQFHRPATASTRHSYAHRWKKLKRTHCVKPAVRRPRACPRSSASYLPPPPPARPSTRAEITEDPPIPLILLPPPHHHPVIKVCQSYVGQRKESAACWVKYLLASMVRVNLHRFHLVRTRTRIISKEARTVRHRHTELKLRLTPRIYIYMCIYI